MEAAAAAAPRAGPLPSDPREKAILLVVLCLYTFGGYYAVGLTQDPAQAGTLRTSLDDAIPLSPAWMYAYAGVYTALLFPIFTVRCQRLFRRVALGYFVVASVSLVVWAVFPVTSVGFRPDVSQLDMSVFHNWGLRVNYALDPPMNLFPSLHMGITTLAALSAWKARPVYGYLALGGAVLVALAICLVKQHFIADGVVGAILAVITYLSVVHAYDRGEAGELEVAYGWRGPLSYLGVHFGALFGLYLAKLAGWRPWE